jgi:anti-sigma B factor antagonist
MVLTNVPSLGAASSPGADVPRVSREGGRTVVWLSGECDIATMTALADGLATAMSLDDADLVVDLTEVQFIDASTIGVLVRAHSFLLRRSRRLTLRNPARCVRRVIDILGLADLLDSGPADAGPRDWLIHTGS